MIESTGVLGFPGFAISPRFLGLDVAEALEALVFHSLSYEHMSTLLVSSQNLVQRSLYRDFFSHQTGIFNSSCVLC